MNKILKIFTLHVSFFLLFSPSLYGMENPESDALGLIPQTIKIPISQTKVTKEEWEKIYEFLDETRRIIPVNEAKKNKIFEKEYKPIFAQYYNLYEMYYSKSKNTLKRINENLSENLLKPLGQFVALFESFFDLVRTHYRTKSNEYNLHKVRLENTIFPIIQRTFNFFMYIYETITNDKIGTIGPLKDNSDFFSVISENIKKHIFYKRDPNGFLLFTIYPHKEIEKNLYQTYLPYIFDRSPDYVMDTIVFSLDSLLKTPVLEERPGLIVSNEEIGYVIEPYHGNTTSFPYTSQKSMAILGEGLKKKMNLLLKVSQLQEGFPKLEILNKFSEKITTSIPNQLTGATLFSKEESPLPNFQMTSAIKNFCQKILEDSNKTFVPFPRTELEEDEQTYLFLLDLQQSISEVNVSSENRLLLNYLEQAFPGESLDQIVEGYEESLVDSYTNEYVNEEEKKIRLEQEERARMIGQGTFYQESKPKKNNQQKKHEKRKQMATHSLEKVVANVANNSTIPMQAIKEKARTKAKQKLEVLKNVNKNGSIKFRKFMQLVNIARQGLSALGSGPKAELNKSSHGNIKIEDATPQTIVRPHGHSKESLISPKGKKKILTNLVESLFDKISKNK